MKIVIDVPEKLYKKWCCSHPANNTYPEWYIMIGTPLPKGHGRLIDAKVVYKKLYVRCLAGVATEVLTETPTIIEADKGE